MRILSDTPNIFRMRDGVSGTSIELTYRTPTASEHLAFMAKRFKFSAGKVIVSNTQLAEARIDFGLQVLTGIREGDFGIPELDAEGKPVLGEDGKQKMRPLASDPASPNYRKDWKSLIREQAADLIGIFAMEIFDGTTALNNLDVKMELEEAAEEVVPFEKSSDGSGSAATSN